MEYPGKSGLNNLGNTCYLNSALQAISHTFFLRNALFDNLEEVADAIVLNGYEICKKNASIPEELLELLKEPHLDVSTLSSNEKMAVLTRSLTFQLVKLLDKMWSDNVCEKPTVIRDFLVKSSKFRPMGQEDAQEAYSKIIDRISEETMADHHKIPRQMVHPGLKYYLKVEKKMKKANIRREDIDRVLERVDVEPILLEYLQAMKKLYFRPYSVYTQLFTGVFHSSKVCLANGCGFSNNNFDIFQTIQLSLPSALSLASMKRTEIDITDCMYETCKEEVLSGDNVMDCNGCKRKVPVRSRLQIAMNPPVLVIQLKRFIFNQFTGNKARDSRRVIFPLMDFDLTPMISPHFRHPEPCYLYNLYAVVNHQGTPDSGHYTALAKDNDKWFLFDDEHVSVINNRYVDDYVCTEKAYLLFYARQDVEGHKSEDTNS